MSAFALWSVPVAIGLAYAPHMVRVGILRRQDVFSNKTPRADVHTNDAELDALANRLKGAHINQLETLGPYCAGVAAATAAGVAPKTMTQLAAVYLGSRALYTVAYAAPQVADGNVRSAVFATSFATMLGFWIAAARKIPK